ncbi:hypothetical protein [Brucella pituitosa]|uniref:hypothetical protein n=1 Tax=Brucella pituitosa TaxID=571256 RepID=UPI002093D184|nr:hypothetical protein [Brucella pituitosa]
MSRSPTAIPARERVAAMRARREAAGMARVWADLPGELVAQLDRAKQQKGRAIPRADHRGSLEVLFREAARGITAKRPTVGAVERFIGRQTHRRSGVR